MSVETNTRAVRRLFEDGFNQGSKEIVAEVISPDYVDAAGARGPAAFGQVMAGLRNAFPDLHYTVEEVVAEGDRVAVRWHWAGTHQGAFRGIAATQRAVTNKGLAIFQLRDGRIVAATLETDRLGFLQALGVVPGPEILFPAR
jgi:steroid delta-isomerase-like uncharacterized protein